MWVRENIKSSSPGRSLFKKQGEVLKRTEAEDKDAEHQLEAMLESMNTTSTIYSKISSAVERITISNKGSLDSKVPSGDHGLEGKSYESGRIPQSSEQVTISNSLKSNIDHKDKPANSSDKNRSSSSSS